MKKVKLMLVFLFQITILFSQKSFSFVFLPDLHLRPDSSVLASTDKNTPIVLSIHTPLINPHAMYDSNADALSQNSESVLDLFSQHNLKIVLQGHNHTYMNLFINGIYYISGGSSAYGTSPENHGFVLVKIKKGAERITFIPIFKTKNLTTVQ